MKVDEKIEKDFIERKFDGHYWERSHNFLQEKWDTDINDLSDKQAAWLNSTLDDCVEKRIEDREYESR